MADVIIKCEKCGEPRTVPDYVADQVKRCKPCQKEHLKLLAKKKGNVGTAPLVDLRSLAIEPKPVRPVKTLMTPKAPPQPKTQFFIDHAPEPKPDPKVMTPKVMTPKVMTPKVMTPEEEAVYQASVQKLLKLFPEDYRDTTVNDW